MYVSMYIYVRKNQSVSHAHACEKSNQWLLQQQNFGDLTADLSRKTENNKEKLSSSPVLTPPCHSASAETPNKRAMSSGGVTSAAAARRKGMAATHCADWQEHRDAITPPLQYPQTHPPRLHTAFDVARRAVKALTEQTVNISAICPILFAFRNEAH